MKLRDWLDDNGYSFERLTRDIYKETGYSISTGAVSKWCSGKTQPNLKYWKIVVEFTGGKVTEPN